MCLYGSEMLAQEKSECYCSRETLSIAIILPLHLHGIGVTGL